MAAHTSLLLVIAFCAATVYALECYNCISKVSYCGSRTTCKSDENGCQTSKLSKDGTSDVIYVQSCAKNCKPGTAMESGFTVTNSCCTNNLCNYSGGTSVKSSYAAILVALGSVLMILKSSIL